MNTRLSNLSGVFEVATLAESATATTCSAIIARRRGWKIVPSPTFEEAVALVKTRRARAALVPGAYPAIGLFFMDQQLKAVLSFLSDIPPLVFAAKPGASPPYEKVYAHPATESLWNNLCGQKVVRVGSNDVAATSVMGFRQACVTNAVAARAAGLVTLQVLRPESPMAWEVFTLAEDAEFYNEVEFPTFERWLPFDP